MWINRIKQRLALANHLYRAPKMQKATVFCQKFLDKHRDRCYSMKRLAMANLQGISVKGGTGLTEAAFFTAEWLANTNYKMMLRRQKAKRGRSMMPLSLAVIGEENIIRKIGGSPEVKKHLENLGFVVGGGVKVITTLGGNVIVNVKESRVAISEEMARKIMV